MTPPLTRTERGSGRLLALTHVILIGCSPVAVQVILALSPGLTTCRFGSSRICGGSAHKVAKFQMYGLYQSSDLVCVFQSSATVSRYRTLRVYNNSSTLNTVVYSLPRNEHVSASCNTRHAA